MKYKVTVTFDKPEDCKWALDQIQRGITQGSRLSGVSAGILLDTLAKAKSVKSPNMSLCEPKPEESLPLTGCDGEGPHTGRHIRTLPTGHGNALLCRACYAKEIRFREYQKKIIEAHNNGAHLPTLMEAIGNAKEISTRAKP